MRAAIFKAPILAFSIATLAAAVGCGEGRTLSITRVKPPVQSAVGTGLAGTSGVVVNRRTDGPVGRALDTAQIKSRFFSDGPTNILTILGSVDSRLAEIETRAAEGNGACLDSAAVDMAMTIFGESVTFKIQCSDTWSDGSGFMAFGKVDSTWYIYEYGGATITAAKATTLSDGKTEVEVWGGVGMSNGTNWDSKSYAAYHIKANESTDASEMTFAGMGVGYCGVHSKSDGTNIFFYGSYETTPNSCAAIDETCATNADLSVAGTCTAIDETAFAIGGLGRAAASGVSQAAYAASTYPATGTKITLDGTTTDAIHFGPSSVSGLPSGVSPF